MNLVDQLPPLVVVIPFLAVPIVMLLKQRDFAWAAATAASVLCFTVAIELAHEVLNGDRITYAMGGWPAPYGIALGVDALSAVVLLVVTGASTVALIGGRRSLTSQIEPARHPMFFAAWLLALAGLAGIVIAADAFNIFVFMEISSLACYVLIAGGPDRRALPSVFKYLVMGTIGATFYLIGVGLIYMMTGTLNLADMESRIHDVRDQAPILVAAGFITIGLALKAALFPLHAWLPNAYVFAPHAVTVFLAACATKVSLYVLLRFDFMVFQPHLEGAAGQVSHFLLPMAALAILVASARALAQQNLKRLLAYSSVAQIGYILLGASMLNEAGVTASVLHIFNHALAKGALFLAVAALALSAGGTRLEVLSGVARRSPLAMAAFVVAGLSLIGVPGTAGFVSKWYLILAVLDQGWLGVLMVVIIVVGSLLAVAYIWRVVEVAYFEPPSELASETSETSPALMAVLLVAAAANIYFGIFSEVPTALAGEAAAHLLGGAP